MQCHVTEFFVRKPQPKHVQVRAKLGVLVAVVNCGRWGWCLLLWVALLLGFGPSKVSIFLRSTVWSSVIISFREWSFCWPRAVSSSSSSSSSVSLTHFTGLTSIGDGFVLSLLDLDRLLWLVSPPLLVLLSESVLSRRLETVLQGKWVKVWFGYQLGY